MIAFPLILLGIVIIFGVIFFVTVKKQEKGLNNGNKKDNNGKKSNDKKNNENIKKEDINNFMEFDQILDNMIVQNNGTRYTMAIKCKGINYDLMSEMEQISVEEGFITFLNTLKYPIQLYVQAQNIDLKGAINSYKENITPIREEYERVNNEYTKVAEAFDSTKEELQQVEKARTKVLNVYEYASDIIQYVERLSLNKSLLQRNFYVLVSYNSSEINAVEKFQKEEIENICYTELLTRAQVIISALASCSVSGEVLDSNELADLLYTAYNRDDKSLMSVKDAIDSGFYRLYSTSKEAFMKKTELLEKQIEEDAKEKALIALKKAIEEGKYIPKAIEKLDEEEQSSKLATELIDREPIDDEIKENAKKNVLEDFKNTKKQIIEELDKENNKIEMIQERVTSDENEDKDNSSINEEVQEKGQNEPEKIIPKEENHIIQEEEKVNVFDDRLGENPNMSNQENSDDSNSDNENDIIV